MQDITIKEKILETPLVPERSKLQEAWLLLKSNKLALSGMVIFVLFFLVAVAGLLLTSGHKPPFNPSIVRLEEKLRPPLSRAHLEILSPEKVPPFGIYLFGTDDLGRDVFSRMLQGAWVSLTVGFVAVGISVIIGVFMGGISGYYGGTRITTGASLAFCLLLSAAISAIASKWLYFGIFVSGFLITLILIYIDSKGKNIPIFNLPLMSVDTLIMRLVDIMLCFPSFFLILTVVALLPASIYNIMVVIGLTSWMGAARFVRAEFLSLREQDFVTAAKALGLRDFRIIFRHMMPNALGPVLVSATIGIASAILTEAGLSFLGFGVPPPHATWGNILSDGKRFIFDAPWLTFIPGISILIVVLAFNLFGEGLRDILNPKLRERSI